MRVFSDADELRAAAGSSIGTSDWVTIDQGRIDLFADACSVGDMKRGLPELVDWLWRGQDLPVGAVLSTGTAIVPPPELSLRPGDLVTIAITGLGELANPVELVDTSPRLSR